MDFSKLGIVISSDSESDLETSEVPISWLHYAKQKLLSNTFEPVAYAKYCKWKHEDKEKAISTLQSTLEWCCENLSSAKSGRKKLAKKNLKRIEEYDFQGDETEWALYWKKLSNKHIAEMNREQRKREAEDLVAKEFSKRAKEIAREIGGSKYDEFHIQIVPEFREFELWNEVKNFSIPNSLLELRQYLIGCNAMSATGCHIIDLRTSNANLYSVLHSNKDILDSYGDYLDDRFSSDTSNKIEDCLWSFFSKLKSMEVSKWENELLNFLPETEDDDIKRVVNIVKSTFKPFIRSFISPKSELTDESFYECDLLNNFVHPIFREACGEFSNGVRWRYGEIPHAFIAKNKADGIAEIVSNGLPLAYFEGSRLRVVSGKEESDSQKILKNGVSILENIVSNAIIEKKRIPEGLNLYAGQHFGKNIILSVFDIHEDIYIHEFDKILLPTTPSQVLMFSSFYVAIIQWVKLIVAQGNRIENAETVVRRKSRKSHIISVAALSAVSEQ